MSCTTCTKTNPIPSCSGILTIGAVDITEGIAIISDVITGQRRRMVPITVELGIASVNLDELGAFLSPNFLYEISLFDGIESYNNPATVTIDEVEYTCFQLEFNNVIATETGIITGATEFILEVYEPTT